MNTEILKKITGEYLKPELPSFHVGDNVKVDVIINEGDKDRSQIFDGVVIARKNGGIAETFTVRKISSGIGVERIFPIHSQNVKSISVTRRGRVRRNKLYYLRDRVGKSAKVKELR
jgi:large subunit ribosomal protein L19